MTLYVKYWTRTQKQVKTRKTLITFYNNSSSHNFHLVTFENTLHLKENSFQLEFISTYQIKSRVESTMAKTRQKNLTLVKHLYETVGYDDEQMSYLEKKGLRSASALLESYKDDETLRDFLDEEKFPCGDVAVLRKLAMYLEWTQESGINFSTMSENFTDDAFDTFNASKVLKIKNSPEATSTSVDTVKEKLATIRLSDVPKFNGKLPQWAEFVDKFTAVVELQGIDDLLEEDKDHESKMTSDSSYKSRCEKLFSILKHACAGGNAGPKVKMFQKEKDGYLAWQKLVKHYYAKGNIQTYANTCLTDLCNLRLEANSTGGAETYISQFEKYLLELEEAKEPVSEGQKVTFFLNGIKDPNYKAYKTICKAQNYNFEKCIQELRNEASDIKDMSQKARVPRRANVQATQSTDEELRLSPDVFALLSPNQKRLWANAVKQQKNSNNNGGNSNAKKKKKKITRQNNKSSSTVTETETATSTEDNDQEKNSENPSTNIWRTVEPKGNKKRLNKMLRRNDRKKPRLDRSVSHVERTFPREDKVVLTSKGYDLAHMKIPNYSVGLSLSMDAPIPRKGLVPRRFQRALLVNYVKTQEQTEEKGQTEQSKESIPSDRQPILGQPKIEIPVEGLKEEKKGSPNITIVDSYILYSPSENTKDLRVEIIDLQCKTKYNMSLSVAMKKFPIEMEEFIQDFPEILTENHGLAIYSHANGYPINKLELAELNPDKEKGEKNGYNKNVQILSSNDEDPNQDMDEDLPNFLIDWINKRDKAQSGEDSTSKSDESKNLFFHTNLQNVSCSKTDTAIIDGGSDSSSIGGDAWIIDHITSKTIDVTGVNQDAPIENVKIGGAITATDLPNGETILLKVNEASLLGDQGCTLFSIAQMRENQVEVEEKPKKFGGFPHIEIDGIVIPLEFKNGLLTLTIRTPTKQELKTCETIVLTSEEPWDPALIHDEEITNEEYLEFYNNNFDEHEERSLNVAWKKAKPNDIKKAAPYLLYPGENTVQKTLEATTQLGKYSVFIPLRPHLKMRNPILTKIRLMEPWATDTWFFKVTSYEGYNCSQAFVGQKSKRTFLYGMVTESSGPDALLEFFRQIGVPLSIRRDNAKMQASQVWNDIMRKYNCSDEFTEPYNPQQNPAERTIGMIKNAMKRCFADTGCDPKAWFRLAAHISDVTNCTAYKSLGWRTPLEKSTGETPDISGLLIFKFWEPVYYYDPPTEGELLGRWLGRAQNYGDTMCYWILNENDQLIVRGTVRSAATSLRPNLALDLGEIGESHSSKIEELDLEDSNVKPTQDLKQQNAPKDNEELGEEEDLSSPKDFPLIEFEKVDVSEGYKLENLPIIIQPEKLIDKIVYYGDKKATVKAQINETDFRVEYGKGKSGIMDYNEIIRQLTHLDEDDHERWEIEDIQGHRWGRGKRKRKIDVLIKWKELDEPSWEPMEIIKEDDPVTLAEYARDNGIQEKAVWKWSKRYLAFKKTGRARIAQLYAKMNKKRGPKYKFGQRVPRTLQEAYEIDEETNSTGWAEAIKKEIHLLKDEFNCFKIFPKGTPPPKGHQFIKLLWTFDVKYDGRKRARLVAGGHMTEKLDSEEVSSSMVSLETIRLAFLAAHAQDLKCLSGDVTSAYIQANTQEKVYTIAGSEFGPTAGCLMVIFKALYGLQGSGKAWHSKFADDLYNLGFKPSKADPDLWMRKMDDHYEYIATFVDDVTIFSKDPYKILNTLKKKYDFKNVGEPEYYNGADLSQDPHTKNWTMSAKTYIKNVCEKIEKLLGISLKNYGSPMVTGDHPELDESDLLDAKGIKLYQMLIGSAQWAVTLGRYDIQYATNTMARYSSCPKVGHLKRVVRIFGYLKHHQKFRIVFNNNPPNYDDVEFVEHDWSEQYPDIPDDMPDDVPEALAGYARITVYVDASHACDLITRRSVTGILLIVNLTPAKWYSKRQNTVETSTYGSELVAARIAIEMIIEYRYKLRMMGFCVDQPAVLFVDNEAVVKNTTLPSSSLKKKHNAIAYHKVREAVAAGIVKVAHVRSKDNRADVLTKALSPQDHYNMTRDVLFSTQDSANQGE